ncbi:MAG TPA: hypothetical protein VGX23_21895 [Actinocrinis sp.]|nr:hypothetical protein [Actinocrinis sp.]
MDTTNSSPDSTPTTVVDLDSEKTVAVDLGDAEELLTAGSMLPEELQELDEDEEGDEESSGLVAGAFGFTALALGFISLSGSWLGSVYNSRASAWDQVTAKAATSQTEANQIGLTALTSGWHAEAVIGGIFALAALLFGAGVLAAPSLLLSGRAPAWARAAGVGGLILGLLGLILAILTWYGVLAHGLTAPPAAATPGS